MLLQEQCGSDGADNVISATGDASVSSMMLAVAWMMSVSAQAARSQLPLTRQRQQGADEVSRSRLWQLSGWGLDLTQTRSD